MIHKFRSIDKGEYFNACRCYDGYNPKPPSFVLDKDHQIVYCDHCGNLVSSYFALKVLFENVEHYQKDLEVVHRQARRLWKITKKYRLRQRGLKKMDENMGRTMVPCCPKCNSPFEPIDVNVYVNRDVFKIVK